MSYQPYYITQYEQDTGQENYFQNFLLPDKAFPKLQDAYCWRGQVKRKQGYFLLGRLRRGISKITLAPQAIGANYPLADLLDNVNIDVRSPVTGIPETYAEIQPGTVSIAVGALTFVDDGLGHLSAGGGNIGTINYVTGALDLTFAPALGALTNVVVSFWYYPALPVMGIGKYKLPGKYDYNFTVPFDQKYAYEYNYTTNQFIQLAEIAPANTTWQGTTFDYFWTFNLQNPLQHPLFWATNFNNVALSPDPIRYYDRATTTWTDFHPAIDAIGDSLYQCRCLLSFKDRLLAFDTWEGANQAAAVNYPSRIRWSWLGDPTDQVNGWVPRPAIPEAGNGGFIDAYTDEHIVSVAYLKDVILVKFQWSSWKLVYTGNQTQPFELQKINDTFGTTSTFSLVSFDESVFAVGDNGITSDDTTAVDRIDIKIPDKIYDFQPSPTRTYGIRDFTNELVYWAYTDIKYHFDWGADPYFNNQTLVFNYRNNSWATFNESWTAFGTFEIAPVPFQWPSTVLPATPQFIAGNQQGFIEILNVGIAPFGVDYPNMNGPSLAITGIASGTPLVLTVPNHNFSPTADYWVRIDGIIGNGPNNPDFLNFVNSGKVYHVTQAVFASSFQLEFWDTTLPVPALAPVNLGAGGTYLGGGTITVVQNFDIQTKVFAPFYEVGQQNRLPYVDFLMDKTISGQFICNEYLDESATAVNDPAVVGNQGLLGNNIITTAPENIGLYPNQANQKKLWHRFFPPYISQNFQFEFKMSDAQMSSYTINNNDFVLHAMTLYLSPNSRMTP